MVSFIYQPCYTLLLVVGSVSVENGYKLVYMYLKVSIERWLSISLRAVSGTWFFGDSRYTKDSTRSPDVYEVNSFYGVEKIKATMRMGQDRAR